MEGDSEDLHEAQIEFDKRGVKYVGWYHSHPRIIPIPSSKDATMQAEMQQQVPFAFGVICSPYMDRNTQKEAFYFNAFRVTTLPDGRPSLLKVAFTINKSSIPNPVNVANILDANRKLLAEAETIKRQALPVTVDSTADGATTEAATEDSKKKDVIQSMSIHQQYASFLSHFVNSCLPGVRRITTALTIIIAITHIVFVVFIFSDH